MRVSVRYNGVFGVINVDVLISGIMYVCMYVRIHVCVYMQDFSSFCASIPSAYYAREETASRICSNGCAESINIVRFLLLISTGVCNTYICVVCVCMYYTCTSSIFEINFASYFLYDFIFDIIIIRSITYVHK